MASTNVMWREHASLAVIKSARRLFARTPLEKLPLTTTIKAKVFRFGNSSTEVTVNFRGVQLALPTKDVIIAPGLVGNYYEKIELDILERLSAISSSFVDVGANLGLYSCIAANKMPSGGKVIAFEPVPENLGYLRRNLELNKQTSQITIEEQAVGQARGTIQIYLLEGSTCRHSPSAKNVFNSTTSITAPVISLDEYVQRKLPARPIKMIKIDVEGYEVAVLRGAHKTLREDKPTLFIEFVPENLLNCGFSPDEFLDLIFEIYDEVFLIDEPRATVRPCRKDDLRRYSVRRYRHMNANLIAISTSNSTHHRVIKSVGLR